MTKWQEVKLGDVAKFSQGKQIPIEEQYSLPDKDFVRFIRIIDYTNSREPPRYVKEQGDTYKVNNQDLVMIRYGSQTAGKVVRGISGIIANNMFKIETDNKKINVDFAYYFLSAKAVYKTLMGAQSSSTMPAITFDMIGNILFPLPPMDVQKKIAGVLGALDDKIELNNKINNNLEQQAQALFNEMFLDDISNVHSRHHLLLSELVQNIDNRGKTPPLSPEKTDFPIIDVKALSGNTRIINYNNCTKFVSQETYLTGFRSGLPKKYDILLSTVGSLGEIKLFIEPKGCIAQNVIGYRSKISPLYIYQYLRTIRNDLLAYDIGSVQPSIKVTHIAKHPIFIPNEDKLKEFHSIAEAITNKIYVNSQENTRLAAIRDALLPKLMSGEIDVSNVDISALTSTDKLSFRCRSPPKNISYRFSCYFPLNLAICGIFPIFLRFFCIIYWI